MIISNNTKRPLGYSFTQISDEIDLTAGGRNLYYFLHYTNLNLNWPMALTTSRRTKLTTNRQPQMSVSKRNSMQYALLAEYDQIVWLLQKLKALCFQIWNRGIKGASRSSRWPDLRIHY